MARAPITKQIPDDDGDSHEYVFVAHPAVEGLRLAQQLFSLAGPSLGKLLDGAKGKAGHEGAGAGIGLLDLDLDFGELVRELATSVATSDVPRLAQDLLKYTTRGKMPLNSEMAFNLAYGANYGELIAALAAAVEANRFMGFFKRAVAQMQTMARS